MFTGAALASYWVDEGGYVYESSELCVNNYTALNNGETYVHHSSWKHLSVGWEFQCAHDINRPPGYMANLLEVWYWVGPPFNYWHKCYDSSPWQYNGETAHFMSTSFKRLLRRCGDGWYGSVGHTYGYNDGWKGGGIYSGYHWLP